MYPISYALDYEGEDRNRLTTFFRALVAIPWLIVGALWTLVAEIFAFFAWFAIVFTGRYPEGLYNFNAKALRMVARVNGFYLLSTDEFPPFNGDPDDTYTVRVGIDEPKPEYSRLKTFFRLIVGIPVFLLAWVQGIIAQVIAIISWFAIVFTGRMPEGMYEPLRSALAYQTRATAYILLMTEDYPPFSYDESQEQPPALASGSGTAAGTAQPQAPETAQTPPPPPPSETPPPPGGTQQ
jgi:Domain of unknown function (DUF4389)